MWLQRPLRVELKKNKIDTKTEEPEIEELSVIEDECRDEYLDRLYLDSDPEFHLNINIVFSYLLLFHIDSHILMVLRRIIIIYLIWMVSGIGIFIYKTYYPLLLDEVIFNAQYRLILLCIHYM